MEKTRVYLEIEDAVTGQNLIEMFIDPFALEGKDLNDQEGMIGALVLGALTDVTSTVIVRKSNKIIGSLLNPDISHDATGKALYETNDDGGVDRIQG